jgi:cobalt-zinc-cadmium efflux system outer membrane protein
VPLQALASVVDNIDSDTEGGFVRKLHFFAVALVLPALLSGCATLPNDSGRGDVLRLVADETGHDIPGPEDHPGNLLAELLQQQPLTPESAVRIALVNNPLLRAEYARLGIAAAAVYDAGRLSNPRLGVSVMSSTESSTANQVTFGLAHSFTDLLLVSSRSRLAESEFERSKFEAGAAILNLAADVNVAYYALVGA